MIYGGNVDYSSSVGGIASLRCEGLNVRKYGMYPAIIFAMELALISHSSERLAAFRLRDRGLRVENRSSPIPLRSRY